MKQNRICFLAAAAAVLLGTAACNKTKEKEFDPTDPAIYTVTVQPDGSVFKAEGEEFVFNFNAPDYWFVSSPVDWLVFEPESGKPGDVTLRVRAKQNIKGERSALITVNAKKQRGKFSVSQEAWPYYHEWAVYGNLGGAGADQDLAMEDQGDQLVWSKPGLASHTGESFLFRMTGSDAVTLGLEGALVPVEGANNTFTGALKKGGERIALPIEGYWEVTLDVENWRMTAALAGRYSWSFLGTLDGSNWDRDFGMADLGGQLKWEATRIPFHKGEEFRFRRELNDAVNLGIDGEFAPVEGEADTYVASLKQDGGNIALPAEGYWTLRLDVEAATLTAVRTEEFPRVHAGVFWENDDPEGHGPVSWSSQYRFALDGRDGNNESIATLPEEVWNKLKTETFFVVLRGENPQVRITTGWWSESLDDFTPGNEQLTDNGDGTWTLKLNLSGYPALVDAIDEQHLLITGDRFTPLGIYPENAWANDGTSGAIAWSSQYRFGLEGQDGNNECLTTFPETIWNKLKTETFYVDLEGENPQIRVTTGWWSTTWTGDDIYQGNERLVDNGDGTFTLAVNLTGDSIVDMLDQQHFLLTGDRWTPLRIRFKW